MGDFYGTRIEIWAGFGPVRQLLRPVFSCFHEQKKNLKIVARRAEWNMRLGRKQFIPFLKSGLVRIILNSPLSKIAAKKFTMRGL